MRAGAKIVASVALPHHLVVVLPKDFLPLTSPEFVSFVASDTEAWVKVHLSAHSSSGFRQFYYMMHIDYQTGADRVHQLTSNDTVPLGITSRGLLHVQVGDYLGELRNGLISLLHPWFLPPTQGSTVIGAHSNPSIPALSTPLALQNWSRTSSSPIISSSPVPASPVISPPPQAVAQPAPTPARVNPPVKKKHLLEDLETIDEVMRVFKELHREAVYKSIGPLTADQDGKVSVRRLVDWLLLTPLKYEIKDIPPGEFIWSLIDIVAHEPEVKPGKQNERVVLSDIAALIVKARQRARHRSLTSFPCHSLLQP